MTGWYIKRGEKVAGPVEIDNLVNLVADGKLLPTDLLARNPTGPWQLAGNTTLFEKPPTNTPQKTSLRSPPTTIVPKHDESPGHDKTKTQIGRDIMTGIGRSAISAWAATSQSLATRAQRRHELKLAKIQAKALVDAQRAQQVQRPPKQPSQPIVQTTVVKIVNRNYNDGCGCSGCGTLLLLILIGIIVLVVLSNEPPTQ